MGTGWGSLSGWYLTVRKGLGECAGGGGRSVRIQAGAQLDDLSQAQIFLGHPVDREVWAEQRLTGFNKVPTPTLHANRPTLHSVQNPKQGWGGNRDVTTDKLLGVGQ